MAFREHPGFKITKLQPGRAAGYADNPMKSLGRGSVTKRALEGVKDQ